MQNSIPNSVVIPSTFCISRFGAEAGERVADIIYRKEAERISTVGKPAGLFYWGIGNSIKKETLDILVGHDKSPTVYFCHIHSKDKPIDADATDIFRWKSYYAYGVLGHFPETVTVTSRKYTDSGAIKKSHWALVCVSSSSISNNIPNISLELDAMRHIVTGRKIGSSSTYPVRYIHGVRGATAYSVGFVAKLSPPYVVKLANPVSL